MKRGGVSAAAAGVLLAASCAGIGAAGSAALQVGRNLLLSKAESNFGSEYSSDFGKMVDLVLLQRIAGVSGPAAGLTPATTAAATTVPAGATDEPSDGAHGAAERLGPIRLDLAVLREVVIDGRAVPVPIEDGEVLRDGIGRDESGDNLKIQFKTDTDCYVYAVWIDATSWTTPLFPYGAGYEGQNPVKAGRRYTFPEGNDWYYLDDYRGVENLWFLVSRKPVAELDSVLQELVGKTREFRSDLEAPATVDEPIEASRGLAGVRPGAGALVAASDGQQQTAASTLFQGRGDADQLLVTRWFDHR